MNAKEIVKALETEVLCESCPHNESNCPDDGCYYIMAAALIDKLQALAENGQSAIDTNMRLVKVVESLQAQLAAKDAEIERLREAQRWIPVEEMLPKTNKPVQVYMPKLYMSVQTGFYDRYYGEDDGERYEHWVAPSEVTHWKELPAPPEEGE